MCALAWDLCSISLLFNGMGVCVPRITNKIVSISVLYESFPGGVLRVFWCGLTRKEGAEIRGIRDVFKSIV